MIVSTISSAPRVGQQFGEHRPECDQDADSGCGGTETVGERLEHLLQILARDDTHGQCAEDQRQERVQFDDRDEDDDHRDTRQEGQDQLPSGGDRRGKRGRLRPGRWGSCALSCGAGNVVVDDRVDARVDVDGQSVLVVIEWFQRLKLRGEQ